MAEFFLELFTEEIPYRLQSEARSNLKKTIEKIFEDKKIDFKFVKVFSTPKRLVLFSEGLPLAIEKKSESIRGPRVGAPEQAIEGFAKSHNIEKENLYKKKIDKGEFYFIDTKSVTSNLYNLLEKLIPEILNSLVWKKSMRWSNHELFWGRPLKSICSIFNGKSLIFNYFHLTSGDVVFSDEILEEKPKKIKNFKDYLSVLKSGGVTLDHDERRENIKTKLENLANTKGFKVDLDEKLLDEVTNIVDSPHVLMGKFDEKFLKIPEEILIITMKKHQKYFPVFNKNKELINFFFIVANLSDKKGLIKLGNERVISARLEDAKFFWENNKKKNLVKQINKLKTILFFERLGTIYDKTQRLRKLGSMISDQLSISKEKVEITASICKSDLVSELVKEFPDLQGTMGKYFALEQGFEKNIADAISEHYFPLGIHGKSSRKILSSAIGIIDRVDTLVGFFGINEKPSSSKDPFALRRAAITLLKIILENKIEVKLSDLLKNSVQLYREQKINLTNENLIEEILLFLKERTKNLLKDKGVRPDIIEAVMSSHRSDNFLALYQKGLALNKHHKSESYKNMVASFKRASNILNQEKSDNKKLIGQPDSILFKTEEEKELYEKINEIKKHFSIRSRKEDYEETIKYLSSTLSVTNSFFENVIVNDENSDIKENRLELLKMFCQTFNIFIDFSKLEGV